MDTLAVTIHAPRIQGDTVSFGWNQSIPNPHQLRNTWSFTYPGLDLRGFAPELLLEIFLALQIKVWATHPGPVEIRLPRPVPAWTVDFWRDYHRATNLDILPLAENRPADPWPGGASGIYPTYRNLVFFGGGKDSGTAASLLAEIGGPGSTLLLSHTASLDPRPQLQDLARRRIVEFIQQPVAAATGLPTATFWSDYLSNWRPGGDPPRPFLEFYHAGTLPLLVAHDVRFTTFGHTRTEYSSFVSPAAPATADRWSGRPETIAAIGAHYQRAWRLDLQPLALCYPLSTFNEYLVLRDRYPAMYHAFVSCASTSAPWCLRCPRCLRHVFASLGADAPTTTIDYDAVLRSPVAIELVDAIRKHDPQSPHHLWHPTFAGRLSWKNHFERVSQLASMRHTTLDRVLAADTRRTLDIFRQAFAGPIDPTSRQVPQAALATLPPAIRHPMTRILAGSLEIVDDLADYPLPDGTAWVPQWRVPLTLAGEVERLVPAWARPVIAAPPPEPRR